MIALSSGFLLSQCAAHKTYAPGEIPYKFEIRNTEPAIAATFDSFNNRIGDYYSIPANTTDTTLLLNVKSRVLTLNLFSPEMELVVEEKGAGIGFGEYRAPSDIAPASSTTGGFDRTYVADPGNNRIVLLSGKLIPIKTLQFTNITNPSAVREIYYGMLLIYSETDRTLYMVRTTGELEFSKAKINGKSFGNGVKLELTENRSILITDPQNGRVLLVNHKLELLTEYVRAGANMLVEPVHSAIVKKRLYVLDKSRSAIVCLNRNGSIGDEVMRKELSDAQFILPLDCGIIAFTGKGEALMFTDELDFVKVVDLGHNYTAGFVSEGRRIILVSRVDRGVSEYRCTLRKTGERWGRQLTR
jgi:hypothetical protein